MLVLGMLVFEEEGLGLERERSVLTKDVFVLTKDVVVLDSKALFQNPKSISSSVLLFQLLDVDLLFGGVICKDKSGCAGNSSMPVYISIYVSIYLYLYCGKYFFFFFSFSSCVSSFLLLLLLSSCFPSSISFCCAILHN